MSVPGQKQGDSKLILAEPEDRQARLILVTGALCTGPAAPASHWTHFPVQGGRPGLLGLAPGAHRRRPRGTVTGKGRGAPGGGGEPWCAASRC